MFAFLGTIGGIFGLNPLGKAAKAIGGLVTLIGLALLLFGLKTCYDRQVVETHDARQAASTAKADRKADEHAGEQRRADDTRLATEAEQLRKAQANAHTDRDRRIARMRCIRLQQDARAGGRVAPACN